MRHTDNGLDNAARNSCQEREVPMHDVERLKVTGENQRLNSSSALHRPTRIDVHMLVDKQPGASKSPYKLSSSGSILHWVSTSGLEAKD